MVRAVNDWIAREWLDHDSRLWASIVVPQQSAELAATEIERCASDHQFVQGDAVGLRRPVGRSATELANLCGGRMPRPDARYPRRAPTAILTRRSAGPATSPRTTSTRQVRFKLCSPSLITEGVFAKFPFPTIVLMEPGSPGCLAIPRLRGNPAIPFANCG